MLLDTASLYYRAFYGMPETVTAPDGTPVNAIRGLLDAIARLVREHRPARLVACLDADWRPAFRVGRHPGVQGAPRRAGRDRADAARPGRADPADHPGADGRRDRHRRARRATRPTTSSPRSPPARDPAGRRGHRRPGPVPARRRRARGPRALHDHAGWASSKRSPSPKSRRSTTFPATGTPTSPCCAATRATACPASPASARRPPPP